MKNSFSVSLCLRAALVLTLAAPNSAALADALAPSAAAIAALDASQLSRGDLSEAAYAFKQETYRRHVARGVASGRARIYDLPPAQLALIPNTQIPMRADAAARLGELLAAARLDLAVDLLAKPGGAASIVRQKRAQKVRELSVGNAYRSASRQFGIWNRNFAAYYAATSGKRAKMPGGEHGSAAADFLREYIGVRVAAPGFSNHQGGIAVDFALLLKPDETQKNAPAELGASMAQSDPWHDSWFWNWLKTRAGEFGFVEYEPEAWHWEFKPEQAKAERAAAPIKAK